MTVKRPENTRFFDMQGMIIKSLGGLANYYFKSCWWKGQPPVALHGKNFERAMGWGRWKGYRCSSQHLLSACAGKLVFLHLE